MNIKGTIILMNFALLVLPNTVWAKKSCEQYLKKLQNVQSLQRQGYSLKRGNALRSKENKARDKWWQCEQGHGDLAKKAQLKAKSQDQRNSAERQLKKPQNKQPTANTPFISNHDLVINAKYQGEQQDAWRQYYVPINACNVRQSSRAFVQCAENRRQQQIAFEQIYRQ